MDTILSLAMNYITNAKCWRKQVVSASLLASIDEPDTRNIERLHDPRWRVAPLGWFSDKDEPEPEKIQTDFGRRTMLSLYH